MDNFDLRKYLAESKLTQGNKITGDFDNRGNFLKNYPELRDPKNQNLIQKFVISVFDEEPSKRKDRKLVSKERLNRPKDDVNRKLQNIVVDKVMFDEMLNLLKKGNYTYGKKLEFIPKGSNSKELRFPSLYFSARSSSDDDRNIYNQDFIFADYYQQQRI